MIAAQGNNKTIRCLKIRGKDGILDLQNLDLQEVIVDMKATLIAVMIGCGAAFFTLSSALTGIPYIVVIFAISLSLIMFAASALLTLHDKTERWGVAIGLSLPPVALLLYFVWEVLREGRGFTWQLILLACVMVAASFGGTFFPVVRRRTT